MNPMLGICDELSKCNSVEEIAQAIINQHSKYDNLKFTYRVRRNTDEAPKIIETREEYVVMSSNDTAYPDPWESWKVFKQNESGQWEIQKFAVFDGKNTYSFERSPVNDNPKSFWVQGKIETSYKYTHFFYNSFSQMVHGGFVGYTNRPTLISKQIREQMDGLLKITGEATFLGMPAIEMSRIEPTLKKRFDSSDLIENDFVGKILISKSPIVLVVHSDRIDYLSRKKIGESCIEKVDVFEGIYYPAKYKNVFFADGLTKYNRIYECEVESIERLTETSRATWVPQWPSGTIVFDQINNKNIEIPHTKEQIDKFRDNYFAQ
ncbi:MAG: hypothetical protein LBJ67_02980 [Planctomycetaceae bacterium]|jgi:hypothetical protein|nr:hypothetical protein [Planctomycetaceae bacterium]